MRNSNYFFSNIGENILTMKLCNYENIVMINYIVNMNMITFRRKKTHIVMLYMKSETE